jgi:putative phage-type endonuclease
METQDVQLVKYDSREEWLAARTASIGASESAALFGLAPEGRESEFSLWAKKAGMVEPEQIDEEWLFWGAALEQPIADRYAKRTGHKLWTPPNAFCVAVHPRLPFLTATIDRWIIEAAGRTERGDLEIKNVGAFNADWREDGAAALPLYVQAQVQHQLAVTGFGWAVVAALVGGNKLETFEIERNPEFIAELEAKAEEFWGKVQRKEAPPADGKTATTKALKRLHPDDNGETMELDAAAVELAAELEAAKAWKKAGEDAAEEAGNKLRAILGANTYGALPDGRVVSLKTTETKGYTCVVEPKKYRTLKILKAKAATKGKKS